MNDSPLSKNQLRWRCRRGMQELDVLLLNYLEQHYDQAGTDEQQAFSRLLKTQDDVLWDWLSGRGLPDDPSTSQLIQRIQAST